MINKKMVSKILASLFVVSSVHFPTNFSSNVYAVKGKKTKKVKENKEKNRMVFNKSLRRRRRCLQYNAK